MEKSVDRTHRVGTVTCGLMFVVYGVLFLLHTIIPKLDYGIFFDLWPLVLISLGVEILVSCTRKNREESRIVYDFPAVLLVMLLVLFVIIMAAADYGMRATHAWNFGHLFNYSSSYFSPYSAEESKAPEMRETMEMPEIDEISPVEEMEDPVIDNWPESIRCDSEGMYAGLYKIPVTIEEPMDLLLSCVTESGSINLWIEDASGRNVFDEQDIWTNDYTIPIDKAGDYTICFEAEYYYGSFVITPRN